MSSACQLLSFPLLPEYSVDYFFKVVFNSLYRVFF